MLYLYKNTILIKGRPVETASHKLDHFNAVLTLICINSKKE